MSSMHMRQASVRLQRQAGPCASCLPRAPRAFTAASTTAFPISGQFATLATSSRRSFLPSRLQATLKEKEEAAIEAIKKDMQGSDIWENEILSILFKVVIVSGIIGVTTVLATAGWPVIQNIINSFPHA